MAITLTDFDQIWASTSPLTPYSFSQSNYEDGWNFVGSTPPSRQMWDGYFKWNDEKQQYIVQNFLPLAGGTMTGNIVTDKSFKTPTDDTVLGVYGGTDFSKGSALQVFGKDHATYPGWFSINANDGVNAKILVGKPDGTFTWAGNTVITQGTHIQAGRTSATTVNANSNANISITFSPAFSSSFPVIMATVNTGYTGLFVAVGSISSSGANLIINNVSSTSRSVIVGWVAIDI